MTRRFYYNISKSKHFGIVLSLHLFKLYFRCIDNIGSVVAAFLQECHEATGFAWQLVGGGLDKSGEIKVVMYAMSFFLIQAFFDVNDRCSVGKTSDGQKFQDAHPNWQPGLVTPWYEFLRLRHRKCL